MNPDGGIRGAVRVGEASDASVGVRVAQRGGRRAVALNEAPDAHARAVVADQRDARAGHAAGTRVSAAVPRVDEAGVGASVPAIENI